LPIRRDKGFQRHEDALTQGDTSFEGLKKTDKSLKTGRPLNNDGIWDPLERSGGVLAIIHIMGG